MRLANRLIPVAAVITAVSLPVPAIAQAPSVVAHSVDVSRNRATLELQLSNDEVVNVTLGDGEIELNGNHAGSYARGGPLDRAWRAFLDSAAALNTAEVVRAGKRWPLSGFQGDEAVAARSIGKALTTLVAVPSGAIIQSPASPPAPPEEPVILGDEPDDPGPDFEPVASGAAYAGVLPSVAGLFGAFVALASIAFGLVSFAPRQLDMVAGTVRHSFVRSFFAGLFAQPLLIPALGVLCVALILTVVGILVLPVAIVAFAVAVSVGVVGGYIAAARALGENYLRRKMARGAVVSADPAYRSIIIGLAGLLTIWLPFTLLGWLPGVGTALLWAAVIMTWIIATAGLGATILSRGGSRGSSGRQVIPQLSGELSWSTVDEIAPSKRGEGSIR
jgi:hypothetical protein